MKFTKFILNTFQSKSVTKGSKPRVVVIATTQIRYRPLWYQCFSVLPEVKYLLTARFSLLFEKRVLSVIAKIE